MGALRGTVVPVPAVLAIAQAGEVFDVRVLRHELRRRPRHHRRDARGAQPARDEARDRREPDRHARRPARRRLAGRRARRPGAARGVQRPAPAAHGTLVADDDGRIPPALRARPGLAGRARAARIRPRDRARRLQDRQRGDRPGRPRPGRRRARLGARDHRGPAARRGLLPGLGARAGGSADTGAGVRDGDARGRVPGPRQPRRQVRAAHRPRPVRPGLVHRHGAVEAGRAVRVQPPQDRARRRRPVLRGESLVASFLRAAHQVAELPAPVRPEQADPRLPQEAPP